MIYRPQQGVRIPAPRRHLLSNTKDYSEWFLHLDLLTYPI